MIAVFNFVSVEFDQHNEVDHDGEEEEDSFGVVVINFIELLEEGVVTEFTGVVVDFIEEVVAVLHEREKFGVSGLSVHILEKVIFRVL